MAKKEKSPHIVRYQTQDSEYAYSGFWQGRDYDQRAENLLLRRYFKRYFSRLAPKSWLTDIGGNYGRLLPAYAPYFKNVAILDYAVNEFHLAQKTARREKVKLHLVRANAYKLPLMSGSQRYCISVRVIHHLEDPNLFLQEMARVLRPGGLFVFQTANKNNLKTLMKCLFTFNWRDWRAKYLDIGQSGVSEDGTFTLIRNYSAAYIEALIEQNDLKIVRKRSISWLRYFKWARGWPTLSYPLEYILQAVGVFLPLGPSNWYVLEKPPTAHKSQSYDYFLQTLYSTKQKKRILSKVRSRYLKKTKKGAQYLDLLDVD